MENLSHQNRKRDYTKSGMSMIGIPVGARLPVSEF